MVDFEIVIRAANAIMNGCGESGKCRGGEEALVALIFLFFLQDCVARCCCCGILTHTDILC